MSYQLTKIVFLHAVVLICLLNSGCSSSSGPASISGEVVCSGTPIPKGRVVFSSETSTCAANITDGKYELKNRGEPGIPLGDYTVTVLPPGNTVVYNPDTGEEEPVKTKVDPSLFPKKYQVKGTSGIKFSPEAGKNTFDIVLEK